MGSGAYHWGLYRDYYRDDFPISYYSPESFTCKFFGCEGCSRSSSTVPEDTATNIGSANRRHKRGAVDGTMLRLTWKE